MKTEGDNINEQKDPIANTLNKIINYLEKSIPNFPNIEGRTCIFDYDPENKNLFLRWEEGYYISECNENYIFDLNKNRDIIGIEILHFDLEKFINTENEEKDI